MDHPVAGGSSSSASASGSSSSSRASKRSRVSVSATTAALAGSGTGSGLYSGVANSLENKDNEYLCPICFELIVEAHITKCGHTFCFECIQRSLQQCLRCPKCNCHLEGGRETQIFPNFAINQLIAKYKKDQEQNGGNTLVGGSAHLTQTWQQLMSSANTRGALGSSSSGVSSARLTLVDVNHMLMVLTEKREQMQVESSFSQQVLLKEFLQLLQQQKQDQLDQLKKELKVISGDLGTVESRVSELKSTFHQNNGLLVPNVEEEDSEDLVLSGSRGWESRKRSASGDRGSGASYGGGHDGVPDVAEEGGGGGGGEQQKRDDTKLQFLQPSLNLRRQRMHTHFDDLVYSYFGSRLKEIVLPEDDISVPNQDNVKCSKGDAASSSSSRSAGGPSSSSKSKAAAGSSSSSSAQIGLDSFSTNLCKFTRYNSIRPLATLSYTADMFNNASIVSSIEFDKDNDFFAIAGVTKRIKIYDYSTVLKDMVDIHYPTIEMTCNSKISCVAWSFFYKNSLVSSDYEGTVSVWDTSTSQRVKTYQEHEKRCWSVDFNMVDTKLIASGSDDARVKLWSTNANHSVASLEAKANVCCVKFNPQSCYHLAFGSADHCVHYYDLRNTKSALSVFKGHKKAVSYVKFLNSEDLVSASTDSQLKLWNVNTKNCHRSFEGHTNEKNFVGLATDGDYITCGSENNSLYIYFKGLSKPLFNFKFDVVKTLFDRDHPGGSRKDDDSNEFVSAVCWRKGTNILVGANSQGTIKILELV